MATSWTALGLTADRVSFREDSGGTTATGRYRVTAANYALRPRRGDDATPMHADTKGWRVESVEANPLGSDTWLLVITAKPRIAPAFARRDVATSDLAGETSLELSTTELLMSDELMGVKRLPDKVAELAEYRNVELATSPLPGFAPVQYDDTGSYLRSFASAKDYPTKACPFTKVPRWALHGATLNLDTAALTFYVPAAHLERYLDFKGVIAASVIPAAFRLPGFATANIWRANLQRITQRRDNLGQQFFAITRNVLRVPAETDNDGTDLAWDTTKYGTCTAWAAPVTA